LDSPAIARFLGPSNWLISKVRVSTFDRARDAIDLAAATIDALAGVAEHAILGEDLIDGRAPTRGVVFTEDVVKIAGQQGRYVVGHDSSPLGIDARHDARLSGKLVCDGKFSSCGGDQGSALVQLISDAC
jgi:hypothetical protein